MTDVHENRDGRMCVIMDGINEILSVAGHCQTKHILVNITQTDTKCLQTQTVLDCLEHLVG